MIICDQKDLFAAKSKVSDLFIPLADILRKITKYQIVIVADKLPILTITPTCLHFRQMQVNSRTNTLVTLKDIFFRQIQINFQQ